MNRYEVRHEDELWDNYTHQYVVLARNEQDALELCAQANRRNEAVEDWVRKEAVERSSQLS